MNAQDYLNDILEGGLVNITNRQLAKQLQSLAKQVSFPKIYLNFSRDNFCGEYSIYQTDDKNEIIINK